MLLRVIFGFITSIFFVWMLFIVSVGGIAVSLNYCFDRPACYLQWDQKFSPQWTFLGGCTIQTSEGRIPDKAYHNNDVNMK